MGKYMQIASLKNKFTTSVIGYREKQAWDKPEREKDSITGVFCGICETFKNSGRPKIV